VVVALVSHLVEGEVVDLSECAQCWIILMRHIRFFLQSGSLYSMMFEASVGL
jgi:hypothetical protein